MKYNVAADLLDLFKEHGVELTPEYVGAVKSLDEEGFSYCSDAMIGMAKTIFSSRLMIAHNMVQNAVDEAKGAARVDLIADRYAEGELLKKMKRHVGDELRHSGMFAEVVAKTGFVFEEEDEETTDAAVDDVLEFDDDLITFICRVHSIEVRSWTMLRLYIDLLNSQADEDLGSIAPVLEEIKKDEIYHVIYTGEQINKWIKDEPGRVDILLNCFRHTNRETWTDLASMASYLSNTYNIIKDQDSQVKYAA